MPVGVETNPTEPCCEALETEAADEDVTACAWP